LITHDSSFLYAIRAFIIKDLADGFVGEIYEAVGLKSGF